MCSEIETRIVRGLSARTRSVAPSSVTPSATSPESATSKRCVSGFKPISSVFPSAVHCGANDVVPPDVTAMSIQCSVRQFQTRVESSSIVKENEVPVPLAGTLPVPVQPVQARRVFPPAVGVGAATLAETDVPQTISCDPAAGVGVPSELSTTSVWRGIQLTPSR